MGDLMRDDNKTKKQLVHELTELRSQYAALKKSTTGSISAQLMTEESLRYAESIVETVREPLLVLDADLKIISANRNFYKTFKVIPGETIGSFIYDLGNKQWDIPKLRELLKEVLSEKEVFDDFEVAHTFKDIGHKIMLLNASQIYRKDIDAKMILLAIEDITDRKCMEEALRESENRYRELSIIDALTQLYNSRHFYKQLKMEIDRVDRYKQPLILLLLDLDDFKQFNDAYGHIEGDRVLSRFGQVVKRCLRQTDSAYRYGGEEFTVILPMTTSGGGILTAERIRAELKKEIFSPVSGKDVYITVSIGLAQYKSQEDMKDFVHRVDQFMYQAKRNGKDRVCSES